MFQEPLLLGNMWLAAAVTYCNAPSLHYVTCHVSGVTRVRVPGPDTDWQLLGIRTGDWVLGMVELWHKQQQTNIMISVSCRMLIESRCLQLRWSFFAPRTATHSTHNRHQDLGIQTSPVYRSGPGSGWWRKCCSNPDIYMIKSNTKPPLPHHKSCQSLS